MTSFPDYSKSELPARQYREMWRDGATPDLSAFLARFDNLSTFELLWIVCVDQRERWRSAGRILAEEYLARFPALKADRSAAVELIYSECLLCEQAGEPFTTEAYLRRFPEYAAELGPQLEIHRLVAESDNAQVGATTDAKLAESITSLRNPVENDILEGAFGRYQIERLLGRGGMGSVYLATDSILERRIAIKVPRLTTGLVDAAIARFFREAKAAARLQHPNICTVYDAGIIDGRVYMSMEYLEGETLAETLSRVGPCAQRRAVQWMIKLALGLDTAHRNGILHRDIKPANVMLRGGVEPVLMDFGLAHLHCEGESRLTQSNAFLGTVAYASPEQLDGALDKLGPASDVYSLSVVMFQMLTGRTPYSGTVGNIVKQVLHAPTPLISSIRAAIDPKLEALCARGMAKDPKQRFATMKEFAGALEATLGSLPDEANDVTLSALVSAETTNTLPGAALRTEPTTIHKARSLPLDVTACVVAGPLIACAVGGILLSRVGRHDDSQATSPLEPPVVVHSTTPTPVSEKRDLTNDLLHAFADNKLPPGWTREHGELISKGEVIVNNLKLAIVRAGNYRVDCEFTPVNAHDALYVVLPVNGHHCLFGLNAYPDPATSQSWYGFGDIGNRPITGNPTGVRRAKLYQGTEHVLHIVVHAGQRTANLQARLDNDPAVTWSGPISDLTLSDSYFWPELDWMGMGVVNSSYRLHALRYTELPPGELK